VRVAASRNRVLRDVACCTFAALAVVVAPWLVGGHPALAAEFFVSTTGNNSNTGSTTAPWRTLQFAASRVGAGDRVTVRAGDYVGFNLTESGAAGSPITFLAETGARITSRNAVTPDGINVENASYVVIDGFEVFGMPRAGVRAALGDFVTVRNVYAHNNERWGIFTGFVDDLVIENNRTSFSRLEHGIYVSNSGDRPIIRGNTTWNNHGSGIHMNGDVSQGGDGIISEALVSRNRIFDNAANLGAGFGGGSGINMDGVQGSRIENNLLYGNRASGISLFREDGGGASSGNVVVNNTIHQPADTRWALNLQNAAINNTVLNNILVNDDTFRGAIDASMDSLTGLTSNFNVVSNRFTTNGGNTVLTLNTWRAQTGNDATSSGVSAATDVFVAPGSNYNIKAPSLALNSGTTTQAPSVDLIGTPRPQGSGIDIGALERPTLQADFDNNQIVNGADLVRWRARYGMTGSEGDANGDGRVNGIDFLIWQRQVGFANATASSAAVPEPSQLSLVMASVVVCALWQKRQRKN
jgi:parallel beta-helix repeat protein